MHAPATAWAGARTQTPEEPRPTEASGRAWCRTTPPTAAQTSPPPFRAQPSGRPPQGAAQDHPQQRGPQAPARQRRAAARPLSAPRSGGVSRKRGRRQLTPSSRRGGVTAELSFPQRRGCHGCGSGKQCLHSKPNGFQKNLFCRLARFLF